VAAIAGGTVGGVTFIFLALALLLFRSQRRKRDRLSSETEAGSQAQLSQAYPRSQAQAPIGFTPEPLMYPVHPEPMSQHTPLQPSFIPAPVVAYIGANGNPRAVSSVTQDSAWSQFSGASSAGRALLATTAARSPTASTPTESVITPPPSTRGGRSGQQALSEEQVDFVAGLYRQGVPAPEVARIVERLLNEERSRADQGSSDVLAKDSDPAPPVYDFKSP
jgi:hypothetical protein